MEGEGTAEDWGGGVGEGVAGCVGGTADFLLGGWVVSVLGDEGGGRACGMALKGAVGFLGSADGWVRVASCSQSFVITRGSRYANEKRGKQDGNHGAASGDGRLKKSSRSQTRGSEHDNKKRSGRLVLPG